MATLPITNRYTDLISYVPSGSFYESLGSVIPYRLGVTEIRLETSDPNIQFGLYMNDKYTGTYMSDTEGNVVFSIQLDRGDIEFRLVNLATGRKYLSWVTVREYALWLAGYAQLLSDIDDDLERVYNSFFVNQVDAQDAEDRFGREIALYNTSGMSIEDYRRQLHEMRLAYRNWGGRYRGVEHAVADFTQVAPFGYARRKWGPNWVLDQCMLKNHRYKDRSATLTWNTTSISGVILEAVEPDVVQATALHMLRYNAALKSFMWLPGGIGSPVVPATDGAIFVPGPLSSSLAFILGNAGPFTVTAGVNDYLYLNIDEVGVLPVQLTTGVPAPTVANVVTDVNAALVADSRYGAPYATTAQTYNTKLLLESPAGSSVILENGPQPANVELFGLPRGVLTYGRNPVAGVDIQLMTLAGDTGAASITVNDTVSPPVVSWSSPGGALGVAVPIPENGKYTVTDSLGSTIDIYAIPADFPAGALTVQVFSVGYRNEVRRVQQNMGLWLTCDMSLLPAVNTNALVDVSDDATLGNPETPDNWLITSPVAGVTSSFRYSDVTAARMAPRDPAPAYQWHVTATGNNTLTVESGVHLTPTPRPERGQAFPQRSRGLLYDYEGYTVVFSGWVRSWEVGTTRVFLSFSWDGGLTWVTSPAVVAVSDTGTKGYETPTFVSFSDVIPATLTDNGVRVQVTLVSSTANVDVDLDSFRVEVDHISSAFLDDTTIVRNRHRQYFGELLWVWSQEPLTLLEKESIGLQHKRPNRNAPFSGIELTDVSADTSAGAGIFDYSYNLVGDTRAVRWSSATSTWPAGTGWQTVLVDGTYDVVAPDGSYLSVYIVYDLLPTPDGSPPAVENSTTITISDTTVKQGHVRTIAPAQSTIDIFDVTEYDVHGVPLNLFGAITEGDFSACTHNNLSLQTSTPFKYSYLYPTNPPVTGENLSVNSVTYRALLAYDSDQDQGNAILYIDGDPLFNIDPTTGLWAWRFTAANEIEMRAGFFSTTSTYKLDYNLLYDVEVPLIDLGATYQDYAWWADYYLWDRTNAVQGSYEATVPVTFNADSGRAYLLQESTMDMSVAILYAYDDKGQREIPQNDWRFLDALTVELDLSQYVVDTQYVLYHDEKRVYETSSLGIYFEHRSGITPAACQSAAWVSTERNESTDVSNGQRYHQLRMQVDGIRSVLDFKLRSLTLKGLHLHGATPSVPGLTNI